MDLESLNATFVIDTFLLLLIGIDVIAACLTGFFVGS